MAVTLASGVVTAHHPLVYGEEPDPGAAPPGTPERAVGRALPLRELVPVYARPCHRTEGGWLDSVRTTVVTGIVLHGECLQTPLCGPRKRHAHVFLKVLLVGGDGTQ